MAAIDIGARNVPPVADSLDDLFDYDVSDVFRDVDTNMEVPTSQKPVVNADGKENTAGLGIDEQIKVVKKRAPVVKLDENRLLSPAGVPKLRRIAKERLKFKGKGHEYSDVARLLNAYQFWLDDLYPRAKFADALAIIEKLGHTKRMQTMRREWINEGKSRDSLENSRKEALSPAKEKMTPKSRGEQYPAHEPSKRLQTPDLINAEESDLYAATPKAPGEDEGSKRNAAGAESLFVSDDEGTSDQPQGDDLDALLAEDEMRNPARTEFLRARGEKSLRGGENFDDEMEAMAGLDDMW
ncbi:chromosome segregation in meiosis- protein [Mycoblastus sanguinarius]|nr:chromosome segregation in meiosis- protein [Mycoblastus sanguinarius]